MIQRKTEWGDDERMKGQQRDEAFNHLSFLPCLSAPLLFDMWGRKPWLGVADHPHLKEMAFSFIVTEQQGTLCIKI